MHNASKKLHDNYTLYVYNIPTSNYIKGTAFYCTLNIFGR